jgi:hypothetical protein
MNSDPYCQMQGSFYLDQNSNGYKKSKLQTIDVVTNDDRKILGNISRGTSLDHLRLDVNLSENVGIIPFKT